MMPRCKKGLPQGGANLGLSARNKRRLEKKKKRVIPR